MIWRRDCAPSYPHQFRWVHAAVAYPTYSIACCHEFQLIKHVAVLATTRSVVKDHLLLEASTDMHTDYVSIVCILLFKSDVHVWRWERTPNRFAEAVGCPANLVHQVYAHCVVANHASTSMMDANEISMLWGSSTACNHRPRCRKGTRQHATGMFQRHVYQWVVSSILSLDNTGPVCMFVFWKGPCCIHS